MSEPEQIEFDLDDFIKTRNKEVDENNAFFLEQISMIKEIHSFGDVFYGVYSDDDKREDEDEDEIFYASISKYEKKTVIKIFNKKDSPYGRHRLVCRGEKLFPTLDGAFEYVRKLESKTSPEES